MENTFEKYANLIRKRAWEYAKKSGVDYSEVESQGFLIYCECLEKYDVTKSGFSTYLFIQLNRLGDFVKTYNRQKGIFLDDSYGECEDDKVSYSETLQSNPDNISLNRLLENAIDYLSEDAYNLLKWILERSWEGKYKPTPNVKMACKFFNKSQEVVQTLWDECKNYWNNFGISLYC